MANEITITGSASINNGYLQDSFSASVQADMTGKLGTSGVRNVSTATAGIQLTSESLASGGVFWVRNLSSVNVLFGVTLLGSYYAFAKLLPGEFLIGRTDRTSDFYYAKSSSGSTNPVQYAFYLP
jgi:hypothetical protein